MPLLDENKPYWWVVAESLIKQEEKAGSSLDNAVILDLYAVCYQPQKHDEITWSAAYVGACLELSGFASTNSLLASSYRDFGKRLETPIKGCIVSFYPMKTNEIGTGHVGFFSHIGNDGLIYCLGGHQGDKVSIAGFNKRYLCSYRWPTKVGGLPEPLPLNISAIDALTDDIPPHLFDRFPAPSPSKPSQWRGETGGLNDCIKHILISEGGFINHPKDPSSATNMGITIETLKNYRGVAVSFENLQNLSREEAVEIYRKKYWNVNECDSLPKPLALLTFNASVLFGPLKGAQFLQNALNKQSSGLLVDGDIGPKSITASQRVDMEKAVDDFAKLQGDKHKASTNEAFKQGWINRMERIEQVAKGYNVTMPLITPPLVTPPLVIAQSVAQPVIVEPVVTAEPIEEALSSGEETMPNQITLSQDELATIVEIAVKEAVRKSTFVAPVVAEPAKPVTVDELRAILKESTPELALQSKVTVNGLAPTVLTAIDRVIGGEALAGKKTLIAVVVAVVNAILSKLGYVSANTSDIVNILAAGLGTAGILSKIDRATEAKILGK